MTNKDSSFIDEIEVKRILEKEISVKKEIVKDKNNKLFIKRLKKAEKREEVFDIMSEEDKKNVLEYLKSIDKK